MGYRLYLRRLIACIQRLLFTMVRPQGKSSGYIKGTTAKDINFFICPRTTPIAVTKQDIMRIFDPTVNQKLNAWQMDYRRFHDIWVLDNKLDSIYLNIKDAAPSA